MKRMSFLKTTQSLRPVVRFSLAASAMLMLAVTALAQAQAPRKLTWRPLEFAILRFNDSATN